MNAFAFHDFDCMTLADHQVESAEFNGKLNQESKEESGGIFFQPCFILPTWRAVNRIQTTNQKKSHNHN